jgi:hypothetical protein
MTWTQNRTRSSSRGEHEATVQLSLDDEITDDLTFGEWIESLPIHGRDQEARRWFEDAA